MHESKLHAKNSFLTLTYNNEHLPRDGSLVPRHLTLFLKRLRDRLSVHGVKFRFFGCGEYGDQYQRPHYHLILFGFDPPDKLLYKYNSRDEPIYSSAFLDEVWTHGDVRIGSVTFDSAAYVARYSLKKVSKVERERGHYVVYDSDGLVHERVPEFSRMSLKPGIGSGYFEKYGREIMAHDTIIIDGREVPSVRFYDKKIEAIDPARFKVIKRNRVRKALLMSRLERGPDRRRVKELLLIRRLSEKVRSL